MLLFDIRGSNQYLDECDTLLAGKAKVPHPACPSLR
jgi:hypothetical protein